MSVQTAQITIRYVNQPKPGKQNGSVKTPEGVMYGVPPGMLNQFQPGGTYSVDYTSRTFNNQQYMTISNVRMVSPPPQQSNGAVGSGGGTNTYRRTDEVDAERMFVTKLMGDAITGGHVTLMSDDLANTGMMFREVFKRIWGQAGAPQTQSRPKDGLDDDQIPF